MSAISDLANGQVQTRSYQLCVSAVCSYDDFTSGTGATLCTLPVGSQVTGGFVTVTTNWDSGTSAGMEIGDASDDNRYLTAENLLAAGDEYAAITNAAGYAVVAATDDILVEVTEAGTAATAGAARIILLYVDPSKADENYE